MIKVFVLINKFSCNESQTTTHVAEVARYSGYRGTCITYKSYFLLQSRSVEFMCFGRLKGNHLCWRPVLSIFHGDTGSKVTKSLQLPQDIPLVTGVLGHVNWCGGHLDVRLENVVDSKCLQYTTNKLQIE